MIKDLNKVILTSRIENNKITKIYITPKKHSIIYHIGVIERCTRTFLTYKTKKSHFTRFLQIIYTNQNQTNSETTGTIRIQIKNGRKRLSPDNFRG